MLSIKNVKLPTIANHTHPAHVPGFWLDRRFVLASKFNALVSISDSKEQHLIYPFNLRKELDASGIDYFFVASALPWRFTRGEQWSNPIEVYSKQEKNVKFELDNAPPEMTVSGDGVISWNPRPTFSNITSSRSLIFRTKPDSRSYTR